MAHDGGVQAPNPPAKRAAAPERTPAQQARRLELPTIIFGTVEIHRLQRELEALEDFLSQATIRTPGKQPAMPRTSRILETLSGNNNLNLLVDKDRQILKTFLQDIDAHAPVVNMSFASDPSATFTAKIVAWFRTNIHPYALVRLGLQPNLAAGFVIRTPNKMFDFSLRNRFFEKREALLAAVSKSGNGTEKASAEPQSAEASMPAPSAVPQGAEAVAAAPSPEAGS